MKTSINILVEAQPLNFEKALRIANDIETDDDEVTVYWTKDKLRLAIAMLASKLGEEVMIDGKLVVVEL